MLKDSLVTRIFIRSAVFVFRSITPLSLAYCCAGWKLITYHRAWIILYTYAASESLFYLLVYLPREWRLNRPAPPYTPFAAREERKKIYLKTWECTPNPHDYLSLWFKGVSVAALHHEDVKDFINWRLWNTLKRSPENEDELEEYLSLTEDILDHTFPPGQSNHTSMAVTLEPIHMMHRPWIWYVFFVGGADIQLFFMMHWKGYRFYRPSRKNLLLCFPFRPFALSAPLQSPSPKLSYWYLQHTSSNRLPIILLHGIGIGLQFYLPFFQEIKQMNAKYGVGIIAIEIMPISSRITRPFLHGRQMTGEIQKILQHHGWSRCVVMSHSYGSVTCTHMLRDPATASAMGPLLLVDPVAFAFHDPHIPWNFLRRKPTTASEIELQYFASTDPDVAYTLTRKFIWPANSLWREDVEDRGIENKCTVALAESDIITNTNTVGRYLTRNQKDDETSKWYEQERRLDLASTTESDVDAWKTRSWTGRQQLEVIWSPGLNHAEIFDHAKDRIKILRVLEEYTKLDAG